MTSVFKKPVRIAQVTDPHLGALADFSLAGVNTRDSLRAVLDDLTFGSAQRFSSQGRADEALDFVAVTGDIAADGEAEAYRTFASLMDDFGAPYAWLPGNHDCLANMSTTLTAPPFRPVIALSGWRLLFLNSATDGKVGGHVDDRQLQVLQALKSDNDPRPIAAFVHHPPVDVGSQWIDKQKIANADVLAESLADDCRIKAIFSGHVHQESVQDWHGIPVYTSPSTCVQFARNSEDFALSNKGPGYRWIDLYEDGQIETGVRYVVCEGQQVDEACTGY